MKVKIYKNLHNNLYSIMACQGHNKGRVIGYADRILMRDVRFEVRQSGRERVLAEQRKNVHAYVVGTLINALGYVVRLENIPEEMQLPFEHDCTAKVLYNPYRFKSFVGETVDQTLIEVSGAAEIFLHHNGMLCHQLEL